MKKTLNEFPYKLAAIDIDDTLVGHDKRVSPLNRKAVEQLRDLGCRIVLASGRRHDNMLSFYQNLGLNDYIISCQGAVARHPTTGEVVQQALVAAPDAAELTAVGLERDLTVMYWSADGVFARQRSPWVERYTADCGGDPVTIQDVESLAGQGALAEKVVWAAEPAHIAALAPAMRQRYGDRVLITITDDWFLEFTSHGATKAAGVAAVAKRYDIDPSQVVAFGDGNNDVQLLSWAGLGVAMSHGRKSAQTAAKMISPAGSPESGLGRAVMSILSSAGFGESEIPLQVGEAA